MSLNTPQKATSADITEQRAIIKFVSTEKNHQKKQITYMMDETGKTSNNKSLLIYK